MDQAGPRSAGWRTYAGTGKRSGVPGHGTTTAPYADPAHYPPAGPWIGMTGSDGQIYGTGNWIQSQHQVTLAPAASWALRRRITALDSQAASDPWTVLTDL